MATFLVSDTHFGHSRMYSQPFVRDDGQRMRPWTSVEEADERMVAAWNEIVRPCDKVYHLGDVAIPRSGIHVLGRLNGTKILIAGNHDSKYIKDMDPYFKAVRAHWKLDRLALSHVPIHPDSIGSFQCNVHGHLHYREVLLPTGEIDSRYFNVSVERLDYRPIELGELQDRINVRQHIQWFY